MGLLFILIFLLYQIGFDKIEDEISQKWIELNEVELVSTRETYNHVIV